MFYSTVSRENFWRKQDQMKRLWKLSDELKKPHKPAPFTVAQLFEFLFGVNLPRQQEQNNFES